MTKLSVNINKIALIRNSRGGNVPDVIQSAVDIERFGAEGITVHPRPDERHITYRDVYKLKEVVRTEFNIEGNPRVEKFIDLVLANKPDQVTLVPDAGGQLTSDHGWDTIKHAEYLKKTVAIFKNEGIRTSIFVDPDIEIVRHAKATGTDRVELYTEGYASSYLKGEQKNVMAKYAAAANVAIECGLGVNAGHDLNLQNLQFFAHHIPGLLEVSIGHALISDALYYGLENTIQLYKRRLHLAVSH